MNPIRFLPWLASVRGMIAFSCIIVTCVWLGFSFAQCYLLPPTPTYRPDFGNARWIAPEGARGKAYFRKEVYVAGEVRRAWVMVTAPDLFTVHVNNQGVVGGVSPYGSTTWALTACPTTLLDITPYLRKGTNTISVAVATDSFETPGSLLLRGSIEYTFQRQDFVSDDSWRASTYPSVLNNLMAWTDPMVDDVHWPLAKIITFPYPSLIRPLPVPPRLFQDLMTTQWITAFPQVSHTVVFTRDVQLPFGSRDGWLQVASIGENQVTVNGQNIADSTMADGNNPNGKSAAIVSRRFHFYYIQPWLHSGTNRVSIRVNRFNEPPAMMAQISFRDSGGHFVNIAPNEGWQIDPFEGVARKAIYSPTVNDMGTIVAMPYELNVPSLYLDSVYSRAFLYQSLLGSLIAAGFFGLHLLVTQRLLRNGDRMRAIGLDALLHVPVLIALFLLYLLRGDAHVRPDWPLQPAWLWLILVLWLVLRWLTVTELSRPRVTARQDRWFSAWLGGRGFGLVLIAITVLSFSFRVVGLNRFSIGNDESTIVWEAHGIWERGYPSKDCNGVIVRASTYELVPYPVTLATLFFGWSDWAVRIPALLFATFTTFNLGRMGRDMFSSRVGLIAALLHAINPVDIYWGHDCFHPAQDQFFAGMCVWSFYRAAREPGRLDPWHFMLACLYFIGLYFSWEGAVFVLPCLGLAMILINPRRWGWLRQWPLYLGVFVVSAVVIVQLGTRAIKVPNYMTIGIGLVTKSPGLLFLDPTTDTTYYTAGILSYPCHLLIDLMFVLGLFYVGRSRPLRYIMFMFCALLFIYSNLMPIYSVRYFYYFQSFLLLGAAAAMVYLADTLRQLARAEWGVMGKWTATWSARAGFVLVVMMCCGNMGLRIMPDRENAGFAGAFAPDFRPAAAYIMSHLQPGDYVMGNQLYLYYAKKYPDGSEGMAETNQMIFDPKLGRFGGFEQILYRGAALVTMRDLSDAISHHRRVWIVDANPSIAGPDSIKSDTDTFIDNNARLVYSSYIVDIHLSEGFDTNKSEADPDPDLPPSSAGLFAEKKLDKTINKGLNGEAATTSNSGNLANPTNLQIP